MNAHVDVNKPRSGITARVWEIATRLSSELGRKATRKEVIAACEAAGINKGTASTQHAHWQIHFEASTPEFGKDANSALFSLQVASDGRLLIPLELRRLMRLDLGGKVTAQVVDGELRVLTPSVAAQRLQALIRTQDKGTTSVIDELIAERRQEALRE